MGSIKTNKLIRSVYINNVLDKHLQIEADKQNRTVSQLLRLIIENHINSSSTNVLEKNGTD